MTYTIDCKIRGMDHIGFAIHVEKEDIENLYNAVETDIDVMSLAQRWMELGHMLLNLAAKAYEEQDK